MNVAAATAFITTMVLGMGGLTTLVWRDRRRTAPPPAGAFCGECDLSCDDCICLPPADVYEATVRDHGDPNDIDFTALPIAW